MNKKRVYIVDDHPLVREGLAQFIEHEKDLCVCGGASSIKCAIEDLPRCAPDIIVADLMLENESGLRLVKEVRNRLDIPVLVLSMYDEMLYAERCFKIGACGYIMKRESPQTVVEALRTVLQGSIYMSRRLGDRIIRKLSNREYDFAKPIIANLSNRELEVFQLLGEGLKTGEIAGKLNLSIKTIETHLAHIRKKLHTKNTRDLLALSIYWKIGEKSF